MQGALRPSSMVPAGFAVVAASTPESRTTMEVWSTTSLPAHLERIEQVLVSKYTDHLPLYRQAQIYARQGVNLDRSTLADWTGRPAWYLALLRDHLLTLLKQGPRLFADETTAPVLDPERRPTKTGQIGAYARALRRPSQSTAV